MTNRPPRPMFLATKGDRNSQGGLYLDDIVQHYRQIAGGAYRWDGTPDDMPAGYIEDTALFYAPGVGCKRVKALGNVILPIEPSTLTVYGRPYDWIPSPIFGDRSMALDSDLFSATHEPCMWIGQSMLDSIQPYLDIMKNAMMTLNINIDGLSQPVLVEGVPGAELGAITIRNKLQNKERSIPTTGVGLKVEVLDLKAQDHTQNLISTIDWCDARILEVMAASNGVEKSSGITTMETVSGVQSVMQQLELGLEKRRAFCDECNDRFKMDMSVEFGQGIKALTGGQEAPVSDDNVEEVSEDDEQI